ncbi:hypothetical protein HPP92_021504 [Vanilla planifolia]|uniref:Retrotransposon gag domain-containing protein n=1 Tax=Vanilla planifolia TaxID=51239 RepID=A0A835UIU4_VANPL|nr:hypothetical protein HPP92_021504 [Vanilla planifolia]
MDPMISDACMFFGTARKIWDYTCRTYSKANDAAQVYEIKVKTAATKQGDKSVTEYANLLQNLWQELDHYRVFEMKSPEDAAILKKFIEKDRVYDFLAGLNPEFDQVRIQILGKEETPPLEETISLVRRGKQEGCHASTTNLDGSALVAKANHREKGRSDVPVQYQSREGQWKENKDNLWCTYCKKPRHTRDKCWKLNGKPPSHEWGTRGGQSRPQTYMTDPPRPQAHMVEQPKNEEKIAVAVGEFSSEDIERLKNLLGSLEKPSGTCSLALSARISTSESPVLVETSLVPNNPDPIVESSPIPTSVPRDFPRFSQGDYRRKAVPDSTQVQESNSDPGIETTIRSDFLINHNLLKYLPIPQTLTYPLLFEEN